MSIRANLKHTATFTAFDNQGNAHTLHVYTLFKTFESMDSPPTTVDATGDIVRDDGQPVQRLEKGKYKLVMLGTVLHSDDPDAP